MSVRRALRGLSLAERGGAWGRLPQAGEEMDRPVGILLRLSRHVLILLVACGLAACAGKEESKDGKGEDAADVAVTEQTVNPEIDVADGAPEKDGNGADGDLGDTGAFDVPEAGGLEAVEDLVEVEIVPPCLGPSDCDDADPCSVDTCVEGKCIHQAKNCSDSNPCTADKCDEETGQCGHELDTCDDGDNCTWDSCMPTTGCKHEPIPDCCAGTVVSEEGFEGELTWKVVNEKAPEGDSATWQIGTAQVHGGASSLYFGSLVTGTYDFGARIRSSVESPKYKLPLDKRAQVTAWVWLDVENSVNYDTLTLFAVEGNNLTPLWGKGSMQVMEKWVFVALDLQAFMGKELSFRFAFDSIDGHDNGYAGVFVDDFKVYDMCDDASCVTKVECSDNLLCTEAACVQGKCQYTVSASCCMNLADCLDDDPCTIDACEANKCDPLVLQPPYCCYEPDDCEDNNVCTNDICDETGICMHPPSQAPGCCKVNTDCEDYDQCTDNVCNPDNASCEFPYNVANCDDKDKCTNQDKCNQGTCVGQPITCDDKNACTNNLCDPASGCYYPAKQQGETCDDGNVCTVGDVCLLGNCAGEWIDNCCLKDADCDDFSKCTKDGCDEKTGECIFTEITCDDGIGCTYNLCEPGSGCYYTPIEEGFECDDGNACTEKDVCSNSKCAGQVIPGCCLKDSECDDDSSCTKDKCKANVCVHINLCCNGDGQCNDFDTVCTTDKCVGGACVYSATGAAGCCAQPYFKDDFSDDLYWTYGTEWERGPAVSGGAGFGGPDPGNDHTDSDDNYIAGVNIGGSASTNLHDFYWLTSPAIDTKGAAHLSLIYWRWLNSDYLPYMQNRVQVYDGMNWQTVWETDTPPAVQDSAWAFMKHDVQSYSNSNFQVRFGFNINNLGVFTVSGWNVDDVIVVDWPQVGDPGMCCEWKSDCIGPYAADFSCSSGTCAK
jgi:hypothetical protein